MRKSPGKPRLVKKSLLQEALDLVAKGKFETMNLKQRKAFNDLLKIHVAEMRNQLDESWIEPLLQKIYSNEELTPREQSRLYNKLLRSTMIIAQGCTNIRLTEENIVTEKGKREVNIQQVVPGIHLIYRLPVSGVLETDVVFATIVRQDPAYSVALTEARRGRGCIYFSFLGFGMPKKKEKIIIQICWRVERWMLQVPGEPPPATGTIWGTVRDARGNGISGWVVCQGNGSVTTNYDGQYSMTVPAPGGYDFVGNASGHQPDGPKHVDVRLDGDTNPVMPLDFKCP